MDWKRGFEKMLRDQMPYAFPNVDGSRGTPEEENFRDALGYILEAVLIRMRGAYFEGYAMGMLDKTLDSLDAPDSDKAQLSAVGAEKAWLKWEGKE